MPRDNVPVSTRRVTTYRPGKIYILSPFIGPLSPVMAHEQCAKDYRLAIIILKSGVLEMKRGGKRKIVSLKFYGR